METAKLSDSQREEFVYSRINVGQNPDMDNEVKLEELLGISGEIPDFDLNESPINAKLHTSGSVALNGSEKKSQLIPKLRLDKLPAPQPLVLQNQPSPFKLQNSGKDSPILKIDNSFAMSSDNLTSLDFGYGDRKCATFENVLDEISIDDDSMGLDDICSFNLDIESIQSPPSTLSIQRKNPVLPCRPPNPKAPRRATRFYRGESVPINDRS
jgi:hypothetical protein